jgi:hypothetical protein
MMRSRFLKVVSFVILVFSLGALACDLSTLGLAQASKPKVIIVSPAAGAQFREGDDISVQSTSTDPAGITRVELAVDGVTVRTDVPPIPQGQTSFTLVQRWKATQGAHTLSVRAYNASGVASDPAFVSITVVSGIAPSPGQPTPVLTVIGVLPTPVGAPTLPSGGTTPVASPTTRPPTPIPPTPTLTAPPGIWAVSIRVEPTAPKRNQPVTFYVSFLNTTGAPQNYRWRILVFPPEGKNAKGDTTTLSSTIPVGASELASADNWTIRGPGGCEDYFARVFWLDENKQPHEFLKPDESGGPAAGFQICP